MSTVNVAKYYFYRGMMPKDLELLQNRVTLAYQTSRDRKLYQKAILTRYVKCQDYGHIFWHWLHHFRQYCLLSMVELVALTDQEGRVLLALWELKNTK